MQLINSPLIEAVSLSKSFGRHRVLRDFSIAFSPGERVLLLGSNGAGKSTCLKILSGLSRPDSGKITTSVGGAIGFVDTSLQLYPRLTVRENLTFFARVTSFGSSPSLVDSILNEWGLEPYSSKPIHELSKGNQWKVGLARAFLSRPKLLLLDEPTSNLDDVTVSVLLSKVDEVCGTSKGAVVIASHDIARLSHMANRVVVVEEGKKILDSNDVEPSTPTRIPDFIELYRGRNR